MKTVGMVLGALALSTSLAGAEGEVDVLAEAATHANAGRHAQAIAMYEQVYASTGDVDLLPIIGMAYRRAGASHEALQQLCAYLRVAPRGEHAAVATVEVVTIRRELGDDIDMNHVCAVEAPGTITPAALTVEAAPRTQLSTQHKLALASAALGAVTAGMMLYFNHEVRAISDRIANQPTDQPWPTDIHAQEARGQRNETRALVFGAATGVALITAGVLYVTGRKSTEVVVAPSVSTSGGGVTLSRGF